MLRVSHLSKHLRDFDLEDISFEVNDGDYFVLLGISGVGKTFLLETLAGLFAPDSGSIAWDDEDLTRTRIRDRGLGLVYQEQALFPHTTVARNIAYGLCARRRSATLVRERVRTLAEETGVTHLLSRYPETLSGGEAQRVALARTLATEPRCLLLDEPLSSLDTMARANLRGLLRAMHHRGRTVIHVTHDYEEAVSLATRVAVMEHGTIAQVGSPQEVFLHPKSEFVARFVGVRNFLRGSLESRSNDEPARFASNGRRFFVVSDAAPGPGYLIVRSEDIALSATPPDTSAQNTAYGQVADVCPARLGVEVIVDVGVELAALVTPEFADRLRLAPGKEIWLTFKATAARFIEE